MSNSIPLPRAEDNIQARADETIRRVEEKHDLLQYRVGDWAAWPILRFWVASQLADIGLSTPTTRTNLGWRLRVALQSFPALACLPRARYFVKTYTSARGERQDGLYKDVYFDDLLLALGDYVKVESLNNLRMFPRSQAALLPSHLYTPILELGAFGLRLFTLPAARFGLISRAVAAVFEQETGLCLDVAKMVAMLANFHWSRLLYGWLLDKVRPEFVLTADSGEFPLFAAARERGIQTIELTHGFCDRYYWPYSWSAYALPHKTHMPIPDQIFVYGDYLRDEYNTRRFWNDALQPVGSLRVDGFRWREARKWADDRCVIAVTTQGIQRPEFIAFLVQFLALAREQFFVLKLFVKLHPLYDQDKTPYLDAFTPFGELVTVLPADEMPSTFEVIQQSHLHLSISSSCHYEALGLGVPTVILPFPTYEMLVHLYLAGHAHLARTPADLLEVVRAWRNYCVPDEVSRHYFERDALANMLRRLA